MPPRGPLVSLPMNCMQPGLITNHGVSLLPQQPCQGLQQCQWHCMPGRHLLVWMRTPGGPGWVRLVCIVW